MKLIALICCFLFISCQSKKRVDTPFNEDVRVILKANKPELYTCYKKYITESNNPKKGTLTLGWKIFDNNARDILIINSLDPQLDFCIKRVVLGIRFDDLYLGKEVRIVRFNFYFDGGRLDLNFRY